jgi:ATP-dependent helicase/nuclease subunit A
LQAETTERQREELNALYVAVTRARHTLAVSSIEPYRAAESSWWQRLSPLAQDGLVPPMGDSAGLATTPGLPETPFYLPILPEMPVRQAVEAIKKGANKLQDDLPEDATLMPKEEDGSALGASSRVGQAMHRLLEWGDANPHNAAAAAREFELSAGQGEAAAAMALCILQGDGAWVFATNLLAWQGNEVELMYQGEPLRIDRLVQRKDTLEWWVLDFKSSAAPQDDPSLIEQLSTYRDAVQAIYPSEKVKAAFLTGQGKCIPLPE